MTMSTESKEVALKNGKNNNNSPPLSSSQNSTTSKQQVVTDLTPATSDDDDFRKSYTSSNPSHKSLNIDPFFSTADRKSLNKPTKNGKSEFEEKIRVGKDYQVVVPDLNLKIADTYPDKALLVWSPAKDIPEVKLEEYIELAKDSYGYNAEQALGMLFWHKHDLQKAVLDLQNFTPFPDEWSSEDKVMFEQAYQFHGKCFHRIRQMLPDKSIASLVKFYYSWKKARTRSSTERHEKKKHGENNGSENGSENGSPNDSDIEEKNDSDNDVKGMGEIEEIIGINNKETEEKKSSSNKTSIMTPSGGKALKRKHDDESVAINAANTAAVVGDEEEVGGKKMATAEKMMPEITITLKSKEAEVA